MRTRLPGFARLAIVSIITALGALASPMPASAQITTDPYRPFSDSYRAFGYPSIPTNLALPNQARLDAARGQYNAPAEGSDRFSDDVFGDLHENSRSARATISPYYRAYRRAGTPYYDAQRKREQLYLDALGEQDPEQRADMLKRYRQESRQAANELGSGRRLQPGTTSARRAVAAPVASAPFTGRRRSALPGTATPVAASEPSAPPVVGPSPASASPERPSPPVVRPSPSSGSSTPSTEMLRDTGTRRLARPRPPSEPRAPSDADERPADRSETPTDILNRSRDMDRSLGSPGGTRPGSR